MGKKHLLDGHKLLVGEEPPPGFNGFTISEEDFMKMQAAGALKMTKAKDTSRKRNRGKYQTRRRKLKKLSKHSKRGNRR